VSRYRRCGTLFFFINTVQSTNVIVFGVYIASNTYENESRAVRYSLDLILSPTVQLSLCARRALSLAKW